MGSQEEQILILVPDSVPEDRSGKLVTLCVNSCVPGVDFSNLNAMFCENYLVDRIQDFACPKAVLPFFYNILFFTQIDERYKAVIRLQQIGAHTVFARQERCLYFRHVKVRHTHTAYFLLHNRNAIPADVTLHLESLTSATVEPDAFVVTPERKLIPPMSRKKFAISFNPTLLEVTYPRSVKFPQN